MQFQDILYEKKAGIAKIMINRPHVYNAFTTNTMKEISEALSDAELDHAVGVAVRAVEHQGGGQQARSQERQEPAQPQLPP